jgi:hypothetical protein
MHVDACGFQQPAAEGCSHFSAASPVGLHVHSLSSSELHSWCYRDRSALFENMSLMAAVAAAAASFA